jgi:hypothetical protein
MEQLINALDSLMQELLDSGWVVPIHVAALSANGSAFVFSWKGGKSLVVAYSDEKNLRFPVHILFVEESRGKGKLAFFTEAEKPKFMIH